METNRLALRRLGAGDRPAILAISAKIWEGDDYVPASLDAWLSDPEGQMTGCFHEERLIGFSKLSFLGPGEAWLEGLRKDPDATAKGVGRALCLGALRELALRRDRGLALASIRFSTFVGNAESIALNTRIGFRRVASFSIKFKDFRNVSPTGDSTVQVPAPAMRPASLDAEALARFREAGWFRDFLVDSWKAWPATEDAELLAYLRYEGDDKSGRPLLYEALAPEGSHAGSILYRKDLAKRQVNILALEAQDKATGRALLALAEEAATGEGWPIVECITPTLTPLLDLLDGSGYESLGGEDDFLVYELPLEVLDALPAD